MCGLRVRTMVGQAGIIFFELVAYLLNAAVVLVSKARRQPVFVRRSLQAGLGIVEFIRKRC